MFVQLRAPGPGASIVALCLAAVAAALYFGPRSFTPGAAPPEPAPEPSAEPPAEPSDGILRVGLESPWVHDAGDGIVHLGIHITPPPDPAARRPPVALAVVLDSSGSMEGLPVEHARFAARSVVERLGPGDRVAVVDFDSEVRVPVPLSPIGADRAPLLAAIDGIAADGLTALHGGLAAGLAALAPAGDAVRRVILVSDGRANVGPQTADAVTAALEPGEVIVSTIGVGTDYDEALMLAVAERGRGGFHHLADPVQLADILDAELRAARAVVARAPIIELRPAPGVELLGAAGIDPRPLPGGGWRLPIGALYADETRALTLRLRVPRAGVGPRPVGAVRLAYTPLGGGASVERTAAAHYRLTASPARVEAALDPTWMVAADRMRVSHVLVDAAALLRDGDLLEAQALLADERRRLASRRARCAGEDRAELDRLVALLAEPAVEPPSAPAAGDPDAAFAAALDAIRRGEAIDEAALAGLDADRLRVLRNAAYARHGYVFKSSELRGFFEGTGWYTADSGFDPSRLSPADVQNVALIKQHEGRASMRAAAAPVAAPAGPGFDPLLDRARRGQAIADADLGGLDLAALRRLRNAVYARHGYAFRADDLRVFFDAMPWYRADPAYDPARLSAVDGETVRAIKARERTLLARAGDEAVRDLELRSRANARRAVR